MNKYVALKVKKYTESRNSIVSQTSDRKIMFLAHCVLIDIKR